MIDSLFHQYRTSAPELRPPWVHLVKYRGKRKNLSHGGKHKVVLSRCQVNLLGLNQTYTVCCVIPLKSSTEDCIGTIRFIELNSVLFEMDYYPV